MSGITGACSRSRSGAPRRRHPSARAGRELLLSLLLSAGACTAAGEFEPSAVGVESAAGTGSGAPSARARAPAGSPGIPVLDPGESESPVSLLPGDVDDDNAGATRSGAEETDVLQDAGLEASDAGDAGDAGDVGSGEHDAGPAPSDAGLPPDGPDAGQPPNSVDASVPASSAPCPGLVFEGNCYEFFDEQVSWNEAEARCITWGGHLASVESSVEDAFIGAWPSLLGAPLLDGSGLWLGGTDALGDGDFRWWDARPLTFTGWAPDQPNNGAGVDCVEKRNDPSQRWYDRRCTDAERYVCERAD